MEEPSGDNTKREMISEDTIANDTDEKGGYVVRGLLNLGNTCYCNSIMQNLLSMDRLRSYFSKVDDLCGPLTVSLKKLFGELNPESLRGNVLNPSSFFECLRSICPQFSAYRQHDSHELLCCLLDRLNTEEVGFRERNMDNEKVGPTFVDAIFGGQIKSTICCTECGHSSTVYDPFLDLSIEILLTNVKASSKFFWEYELPLENVEDSSKNPLENELPLDEIEASSTNSWEEDDESSDEDSEDDESDSSEPETIGTVTSLGSLESCLSHFTALELLSDKHAWPCENCSKIIKLDIAAEFDSLNIQEIKQENDFSQLEESLNESNGQICDTQVKRGATKRFLIDKAPLILTIHLKRFVQDDHGSLSKLNGHVEFGETLDLLPFMDPRNKESENYTYRLLGVVEHSGTMKCGHYIAYVRGRTSESAEKEDGWVFANDVGVRQVELKKVLGCEAYILFYEKI